MTLGLSGRRRVAATVSPRTLAVVVAALIGVASACGGTNHGAGPTTTTPTPSSQVTATSTPGFQWTRVDSVPGLGGGPSSTIAAVLPPAEPNGTWLAVGSTIDPAGDVTATSWTAPDAIHWTTASLGPAGANSQIRAATQWGTRQLAVGAIGSGPSERAAVWLSAGPGQPLLPVQDEATFAAPTPTGGLLGDAAGTGAEMDQVATGALGIFASGTVNGQQAMWYSSDGSRWTRLSGAERVINAVSQPAINDLLVAANGVWAVGSEHSGTQTKAAVWTSTDGIHWYQVTSARSTFAADGDRVINSIATLGSGFVAVGGVRTGSQWIPASWISPDGVSWSQASESFPEAPRATTDNTGTTVTAVTDDLGYGLVAVGGSPAAQRIWTSTDGQSWTEVPLPAGPADAADWHLGLVAALGQTTVVADNTVGAPRLLVDSSGTWNEVTASPTPFGAPTPEVTPASLVSDGGVLYLAVNIRAPSQALGNDTFTAAVLSSTDGVNWRVDMKGGVFAGHQIAALLAVQTGLLAAGGSISAKTGVDPMGTVWSSTDGLVWTLAPSTANAFEGVVTPTSVAGTKTPKATTPSGTTPGGTTPGGTTPSGTTPSGTTPGGTTPSGTTPSGRTPKGTTSRTTPASLTPASATTTRSPTAATTATTTRTPTSAATAMPKTIAPGRAGAGPATLDALARVGATVVALGQAGSGPPAAAGQPLTTAAAAWLDHGGTWQALGPLDTQTSLATEIVSGACAGPQSVAAVGSSTSGLPGTQAAAWLSNDGTSWQGASVSPTPSSGAEEEMVGCLSTGSGYLAYGTSPGPAGTADPALWQSTDGTTWTRQSIAAFPGTGAGPIDDLALQGTTWLATSGAPAPAGNTPAPDATAAGSTARLWQSGDGGATWTALNTTSAPWTASLYATANLVGFVNGDPVVVGSVDGQLGIWEGQGNAG